LEAQLEQLQAILEEKREELLTSSNDHTVLERTLETRRSHLTPLLFRCLPLEALILIASFSHEKEQLFLLNKLWLKIFKYSRSLEEVKAGSNHHHHEIDSENDKEQ